MKKENLTDEMLVEQPKTEKKESLSAEELQEKKHKAHLQKYKNYDFVEKKSNKENKKKLVASKILGIEKNDNISKRQKFYKNLFTALFIVFVVAVLAATAYKDFFAQDDKEPVSFSYVLDVLSTHWFYIIFALVALFCCYLTKALKLSVMCKATTKKFHFKTCFETGIIGHYYNNVTPLAVGGQPFEIYHLSKHGVRGGVATSLPIATFFLNQIAFVVLGIVSLSLLSLNTIFTDIAVFEIMAIIGLFCCIIVPMLVITFSLMPRVGAWMVVNVVKLGAKLKLVKEPKKTAYKLMKTVIQNSKCLKMVATRPLAFILLILFSFAEQAANVSIAYFTLKFFGFDVLGVNGFSEWLMVAQVCFILNAAISFIPTPGNSGAADLSFFSFFERGLAKGLAFPAMLTWRLLVFYSFIIIGFVFASLKKKSDRKKELSGQELT